MMRVMGFPKKLLGEGETLILELRPHVKRLLGPVALLLVVAPAASFVAAFVPAGAMQGWVRGSVALAAALVLARWSLWPFLVWWNTVYVITDRRLVTRRGVLSRHGHDMPLTRLNDVTFSHGIIDRMLGCGDLIVESAGERGQLVLDDVPRVEQVQRTLYRLSDEARDPLGDAGYRTARLPVDDPDGLDDGTDDPDDGQDDGQGGGRFRWGGRR